MSKISYKNKVEGCLFIASLLDTIGYFNSKWEFNYGNKIDTVKEGVIMNYFFINNYQMIGKIENIDFTELNSSDDTILIIATGEAVANGGGEKNYIDSYLKYYDQLKDEIRQSGISTLSSLEKIRLNKNIKTIEYSSSHGGNGAAIRTAPIGLKYLRLMNCVLDFFEKSLIISSQKYLVLAYGDSGEIKVNSLTGFVLGVP
jgi:ADP-ribosylglycohydrolase